jgi:hypothetical protein
MKTELKSAKIQVRDYPAYRDYLEEVATKQNKTVSQLVQDTMRIIHPMPKNWKPKQ